MKILIKKRTISSLPIFLFFFLVGNLFAQETYFIKFNQSANLNPESNLNSKKQELNSALTELNYNIEIKNIQSFNLKQNIYVITLDGQSNQINYIKSLQNLPNVSYVQKNNIYKIDSVTNDSLYAEQWGLRNINIEKAWDITVGEEDIIIAVIDTGIDYNHPDLKNQIYINKSEDLNSNNMFDEGDINGIDDDGNGFIDDVQGWDFTDRAGFPFPESGGDYLDRDNDPYDENKHGTIVAGVIAAERNNGIGISGVAPGCKLLNLRAFDPSGFGEEDDVAAAILYAVNQGADIINMSFGDDSFSYVLKDVIEYASNKGVVFVGSAGNSSSNMPHYPSSYPDVISVGASTINNSLAGFSNYGSTIDIVAPGSNILTTLPDNKYSPESGTSLSAPFVSGAIALLLTQNRFTPAEIKQILKTTSKDILVPGWDEKSGAGLLNIGRALSIPLPSKIAISFPEQDYSTSENLIDIFITVLSPLFKSYSLDYGVGLNPVEWKSISANNKYQVSNEKTGILDLANSVDTSYTLRLIVELTDGKVLEERTNIYYDESAPEITLINLGSAFLGDKPTIFASAYTDDKCVVRMHYRTDKANPFNSVTLDGFSINNKFVKQLHWGYLPEELVNINESYEIYISAENLAGKSSIDNNNSQNYLVNPGYSKNIIPYTNMDYSLPPGKLFDYPVNITDTNYTEILLNEERNSRYTTFYKFNGDNLVKYDSLYERIPKSINDFNNDGKTDYLGLFVRNGFIDSQEQPFSSKFISSYSDSSGNFWPILADDIDDDGKYEIISISGSEKISIWEVGNNLNLTLEKELLNFSPIGYFGNSFESPEAVICDLNNDGKKEIWTIDFDGDILSYDISGAGQYAQKDYISTGFSGAKNNITAGDFDGDGKQELAVLLNSIKEMDIAPFYLLIVIKYVEGKYTPLIQHAIIDPSIEFNTGFQKAESAIRFADITPDKANQLLTDELIIFAFPYAYILEYNPNNDKNFDVLFTEKNVNSSSILYSDLNKNGAPEIALPSNNTIIFKEFGKQMMPNIPSITAGFSLDSEKVKLELNYNGLYSRIYKSENNGELLLIDSVLTNFYIDSSVSLNKTYNYVIQTYDDSYEMPYSTLSNIKSVFHHTPGKVDSVIVVSANNLLLKFDTKIRNKINNLESFIINGSIAPNTVVTYDEKSYLLNFNALPIGDNTIVIQGLKDFYGSDIEKAEYFFTIDENVISNEFFIQDFSILSSNKVALRFNMMPMRLAAIEKDNYTLTPNNPIEDIELNSLDGREVVITTKYPIGSVGITYSLQVVNLHSIDGTPINHGAGSYINLSSYSDNLDDVYLFPQPFNSNQNDYITFANLTKNADIIVFTLNGKKLKTIEKRAGDGGFKWDCTDQSGIKLSSGIYIYHILAKDDNDDIIESITGKIAIIK